jgi:hypothetical protein
LLAIWKKKVRNCRKISLSFLSACHQYTLFLKAIDEGKIPNGPAPDIAKKYWNLAPDATLRDVVLAVRADEAMHRDVNHTFSQKAALGLH